MTNPLTNNQNELLNDLNLLSKTVSKGQSTKLSIIEGAIASFALDGIEKSSFQTIASHSNVTRQLVQKYFPDKEELFLLCVKFIRFHFQQMAKKAIETRLTAPEMVVGYVGATFRWIEKYPTHGTVWLLFYYYTRRNKELLKLNTDYVKIGEQRIMEMLAFGATQNAWNDESLYEKAKKIQLTITGALVTAGTEAHINRKELEASTVELCMQICHADSL